MFEHLGTAGIQFGISYLWAEEGVWITGDEETKRIENMGKDHIENCISMLKKQVNSTPINFVEFLKCHGENYLKQALKNEGKELSTLSVGELTALYNSILIITTKRLDVKLRELNAELKKRV